MQLGLVFHDNKDRFVDDKKNITRLLDAAHHVTYHFIRRGHRSFSCILRWQICMFK